jgi:hypothetical protein
VIARSQFYLSLTVTRFSRPYPPTYLSASFSLHVYPYWDFSVTEEDLDLRKATRIGSITSAIGAGNFISLLRFAQLFLNRILPLCSQGNNLFCCIEKSPGLKPWMAREGEEIVFNRQFGHQQ